jgi:ABC-type Fe3+ transport system permease subunit
MLAQVVTQASGASEVDLSGTVAGWPRPWTRTIPIIGGALLLAPWIVFALYLFGHGNPASRQPDRYPDFQRVFRVYEEAWRDGPVYSCTAGLMAIWLTLALDYVIMRPARSFAAGLVRSAGWFACAAAAIPALLPPILVGDAFVIAYLQAPLIYDQWAILGLATAARYALIPVAFALIAGAVRTHTLSNIAALDGASWWTTCLKVRWPLMLGPLLVGGGIAALLAMTEVAVTQMVTPPGVGNLGRTLLNEIHFGRNTDVIGLSLLVGCFIAVAVAGALATSALLHRRPARGPTA